MYSTINDSGEIYTVYQRRYPRRRGAPNLVSLLPEEDTCLSINTSSDCGHSVDCFDLTSKSFDVNQIQPPSPPRTPPHHTDTSGTAPPPRSISPSSSFPSPSVTTDIEMIRTETVRSHDTTCNNMWVVDDYSTSLVLTITLKHNNTTHNHSIRSKKW